MVGELRAEIVGESKTGGNDGSGSLGIAGGVPGWERVADRERDVLTNLDRAKEVCSSWCSLFSIAVLSVLARMGE